MDEIFKIVMVDQADVIVDFEEPSKEPTQRGQHHRRQYFIEVEDTNLH